MEDAMIISKGSLDRGFAHGQVYKTEVRNIPNPCLRYDKCLFKVFFTPFARRSDSRVFFWIGLCDAI